MVEAEPEANAKGSAEKRITKLEKEQCFITRCDGFATTLVASNRFSNRTVIEVTHEQRDVCVQASQWQVSRMYDIHQVQLVSEAEVGSEET